MDMVIDSSFTVNYYCLLSRLALGATAVGIGKPVFFALSVGGEEAVSYMLQMFQTELEAAMAICGVENISDVTASLVTRHPTLFSQTASGFPPIQSSL